VDDGGGMKHGRMRGIREHEVQAWTNELAAAEGLPEVRSSRRLLVALVLALIACAALIGVRKALEAGLERRGERGRVPAAAEVPAATSLPGD